MGKGEVNVSAVCDVDDKRLENAAKIAGPRADVYRDYRYILQRKDIDAVMIATPDHWHGVQFVHAAECGKHIYCESPACATIEEGKAMLEAAQDQNRHADRRARPLTARGVFDALFPGQRRDRQGDKSDLLECAGTDRRQSRGRRRSSAGTGL